MTDKFRAIYEAFENQTEAALTKGDAAAAAALYDEHAVVVDRTENKHFYGHAEIKGMLEAFLKQGDAEPKKLGTKFFEIDDNRFLADSTLETKHFLMTHKVLIQQLFQKKGAQWKCVYENISV